MRQLALDVQLRPESDFDGFVAGPNAEALAAVDAWSRDAGATFLYLCGASGCGKSHLLQAAVRRLGSDQARVAYVPLARSGLAPEVLRGLEESRAVALDDVQAVAGDGAWERALFALVNRLREHGARLITAAPMPLPELPLGMADLRSRLGWGPSYRLRPLREADCASLLERSALQRGLRLDPKALDYILTRFSREPRDLLGLMDALDHVSLVEKRAVTVPLVRRVLDGRGASSTLH